MIILFLFVLWKYYNTNLFMLGNAGSLFPIHNDMTSHELSSHSLSTKIPYSSFSSSSDDHILGSSILPTPSPNDFHPESIFLNSHDNSLEQSLVKSSYQDVIHSTPTLIFSESIGSLRSAPPQ